MKFLIIGDIYGKVGRRMLEKHLPDLRTKYVPDVVIANTDNISHGRGPLTNQLDWLEKQGVDIFTGGNHTFDSMEMIREYLDEPNSRQLRPDNLKAFGNPRKPEEVSTDIPGTGHRVYSFGAKKIFVVNLIGTAFMDQKCVSENPFQRIDALLGDIDSSSVEAILIDFHKETTAEGYAMANYLDGRASLLWGTHTHIQTNDAEIWPKGMGFINDIGFAGVRHSIIGAEWDESLRQRFIHDVKNGIISPEEGGLGVFSGIFAEVVHRKCIKLETFRICE